MKRNTLNFVVDALTMLALLGVVLTGLFVRYALPTGSAKLGWTLLGLGRHEWGDVHFWFTVATGSLLLLHLALHWSWVCATTSRVLLRHGARSRLAPAWQRNLIGVATLAILISAVTILVNEARLMVRTPDGARVSSNSQSTPGDHRRADGESQGRQWRGGK